jgi:signal transduction histidine kinase
MINLLSNALKFTDEGEVTVRVQESGIGGQEMLAIAVSDTGIGIPEDQLGRIFEEFRQVDGSSTRKVQGTGLGLAITKRLIELMGGRMGVTSEIGKGSVFTVEIPVVYQGEI